MLCWNAIARTWLEQNANHLYGLFASHVRHAVLIQKRRRTYFIVFLVYVSGRVYNAKTSLFGLFHFEAFIRHHHVPVSGGFNSHHDSVKPLFHSPLLDRLKRHLELACSRSASYLSFKLILYPNSDSTSQLTRLTTSGDISLNPGPERYSDCGNSVARNHRSHPASPANFGATSSAA